jgi:hypothetical protein
MEIKEKMLLRILENDFPRVEESAEVSGADLSVEGNDRSNGSQEKGWTDSPNISLTLKQISNCFGEL